MRLEQNVDQNYREGEIKMKMLAIGKWGILTRLGHYQTFLQGGKDGEYQSGDAKENERGRLPDDEHIQIPAVWSVELYTPSQIRGLAGGIERLGWERGHNHDDSLLKWMADARQGGSKGWRSLGLVSDSHAPHPMSERTADLPKGVVAALPVLVSLTPSITALVTGFILDAAESDSLDSPLRATYATRAPTSPLLRRRDVFSYVLFGKRARFSRTIHHPDSQRRDALRKVIGDIEKKCACWTKENFPGIFASGIGGGNLPSAVLMVTEKIAPASDKLIAMRALDGLSMGRDGDHWVSSEWPCVRLGLPDASTDNQSRLVFSCRRRDAFPDSPGYRDPTSNWTIAQRADGQVRGLLTRWALSCALDGYLEELSVLRDKSAGDRTYHVTRDLKQLRSLVRHRLYDIVVTSQEIEEFTGSSAFYRYDTLELTKQVGQNVGAKLTDGLCSSQREQAQRMLRDANLLQSVLSLSTNISQTITNLKIQLLIIVLTVVSIFIAAWPLSHTIMRTH